MAIERRVTTQDISWFLDLNSNGQLDLNPPYQRRSVWSPKDRRFFLDTIFRGYPSPSIFLHKQMERGKTIYYVVDGKQRLETILKFAEDKIAIDRNFGDERLAGRKWKYIRSDESLARTFWDYVLPVEFTNIIDDTSLVKEVFDRLNRNSRRLTEQELRHAKYDGWFISFVEREAESPDWERLGVVTTTRAKRMADVQFLSELLIVLLRGDVGGFDQEEISEYCAQYDNLSDLEIPIDEDEVRRRFERTKCFLLEMERHYQTVSKYAHDFTNFYTLWSVVALDHDNLPECEGFNLKYSGFMDQVNKYKDADYFGKVMRGEETPADPDSFRYYQNSVGARTEPPQRRERRNILFRVLSEVHLFS